MYRWRVGVIQIEGGAGGHRGKTFYFRIFAGAFFFFCLNCDFLDKLLVFQNEFRDFPGGPVVKSLHSQFMGLVFDPWMGS